jgi:polyphosphate glucokinase
MKALGIDIGGSAVKGAPVDTVTGRILAERCRIATPECLSPAQMARTVGDVVRHFHWKGPVGIGFPGVIQGPKIATAANLHRRFVGCDGAKLFQKSVGRPVALINDAAAAGLAEMHFGRGRGFSGKVLLLTLGTGVGSVIAYQGMVVPFELGHLLYKGKDAEKSVAASVRTKKGLSWEQWGRRVGRYIEVLEAAIWPEMIIIGGGVSAKHKKFFRYIRPRACLFPASLGNEAGIVGAALWAAEQ